MENRQELNRNLAQMLKGGVIMDVTTPEQAKIAESAGACAVMALERIPADIRAAGGVAVIAHPMKMKRCDPGALIRDMARIGIEGVEAHYCGATEGETRLFSSLARENGLFITCGSDYHGGMRSYAPLGGAWRVSADLVKSEKILLNRYVR